MKLSRFAMSVTPYEAGEQPKGKRFVKLNTNENPYPPAPECAMALKAFDADRLKLYPGIAATELREAIAEKEGVDADCVFIGNGSDEVLSLAFRALFDPHGEPVVFPSVTYSFYPVFCAMYGINTETVENEADFTVAVEKLTCGQGVVLANPNAPTSLPVDVKDIELLLSRMGERPVVVDEAYIDFARRTQTAVPLLRRYDNLVVVKTFSKSYSLAGIRCGYMIARPETVAALERVRDCFNSYPVDSVCQAVCTAAIKARGYHEASVQKIIETRDRAMKILRTAGYDVLDSDTNFLLVSGGESDYLKLKERGVLVRWFSAERVRGYTRVTVGSDEETDVYLRALLK